MNDNKSILITSPGIARYPRLSSPDTKFDQAGVYRTELILSGEDAEKLKALIDEAMQDTLVETQKKHPGAKPAHPPYKVDEDDLQATIFKFKMKASGINDGGQPWEQAPKLKDSQKQPIPEGVMIGGPRGSVQSVLRLLPDHSSARATHHQGRGRRRRAGHPPRGR